MCCGDRGDGQIVAAIFGDEGWRLTDGVGPDYGTVLEIAVVEDEVEVVLEDGVLYWRPHRDDQWRGEETGSDATRDTIVSGVRFVHTDAEIRSQCERDAATLGWAVPCPSVLPGVESPESCARTCVYTGGDPPIPMFYLSIDNFPGPEPEGIATVRHLVIEAFPQGAEGVLDPPCVEASALPPLATKRGDLEMFRCGERTGANEGLIRHGEAVNQHHDGVRWYRDGIAYAVTLHRGGLDVNEILRRVVDGIEYVG